MYHTLGAIKNDIGIGENEPGLRLVSERETLQDCRRVIVATAKEKRDLARYYDVTGEKIGVVPCGVNLGLFRPADKMAARQRLGLSGEKIMLFVGRVDPLKGIDRLIRTLPLLKNQGDLKLIVVGGDANSQSEVAALQKLAADLDVPDSVCFQGIVKQEQLPYYYSAADVCVVPSYYESFGLVALEALACGTPVVAADVGDLRNIIRPGETGYVAADNSPENLAAGISSVLSAPLDEESARSIRASVARFDWSRIAEKIVGEMRLALESPVASVT
jgi:D-inositol-3-phosphate glycosyltransferase